MTLDATSSLDLRSAAIVAMCWTRLRITPGDKSSSTSLASVSIRMSLAAKSSCSSFMPLHSKERAIAGFATRGA